MHQALTEANDGVHDGPGSHTEEAQLMASCLHLLLQTMAIIFSWQVLLNVNELMVSHENELQAALIKLAQKDD